MDKNFVKLIIFFAVILCGGFSVNAATRTVDTTADNAALTACTAAANDCSLRGAVAVSVTGDTVNFSSALNYQTITLSTEIPTAQGITINGPGANLLTISGSGTNRHFYIDAISNVITISGLTLQNGNGGGQGNTSSLFGGSIYNRNGLLILDKVQIQHNLATFGGAVMSIGSLVITDSTFYNNTANTSGGAVYVFGSILEATNATFSGNRTGVNGFGGGILINSSNTNSILQNVTVTGNVSLGGGNGGGLYSVTYIRVVSSVIAGNTASTNSDVGGSIANLGFNILSGDPLLAPLADNGGTTRTHLPQCGSPLINAGDPNSILTTDQRGTARPIEGRIEIGAVELSRIAISPNSLTAGTVGAAYSNTLTAMCETAPYNFTIESGTLPNGLTLSNSGSLAGTPTASGIFNFTVRVTAANGVFGLTNYALKVFSFTPAALPVGLPNVAYSQSITVTGGTAPYTFALDSGTLPSGFSVSSSGLLSGTTTQIGAFNFAVRATDSNGAFALKNYALNVGYYVINAADSGTGSLRQTILNAPIDGTISFDPAFFNQPRTISIASLLIVNKNLTINGTGANFVIIDGQNATRILNVDTATLTLSGVRLTRGNAGAGNPAGGILVNGGTLNATSIMIDNCIAGSFGGAISNAGSLTLNTSLITGNSGSGGAGISNDAGRTANINYSTVSNNTAVSGGGIGNNGTVNSFGSTFSGNTAQIGGGIYNDGFANLINSTLSGNRSTSDKGAGIYNGSGRFVQLLNATITNNQSDSTAGAGVWNENFSNPSTTVRARNSIIAGNISGNGSPVDFVGGITNLGNNLINNSNPGIAPLGNYGGSTPTHALLANSPALNAGDNCALTANTCGIAHSALTDDQRGTNAPRKIGASVDIGAFEQNITFNQTSLPNGSVNANYNQTLSVTRQTNFADFADIQPKNLVAPFTFSIVSIAGQNLPPGLSLAPNGTLSGTPTMTGTFTFTVKATDADGMASVQQFAMQILAPTAANVSVSGRISAANGNGIRNIIVTLTDTNGNTLTTRTGSFGYFRFDEIGVGETYIISVSSKRFTFIQPSRVISVNDELTNIDFIAQE